MSELRVKKVEEFIKQEIGNMLLMDLKDPPFRVCDCDRSQGHGRS